MGQTVSEAVRGAGTGADVARRRAVGVVPWGVAAGAVAWCIAGSRRAAHMENYPWNVWTPIGYGAVKGMLLGLLAGWCAVSSLRVGRASYRTEDSGAARFAGLVFGGGLLGGLVPGSVRAASGPVHDPAPVSPFVADSSAIRSWWRMTSATMKFSSFSAKAGSRCALSASCLSRAICRLSRAGSAGGSWWAALRWPTC